MSYAVSAALQAGIFQTLSADPDVTGIVGSDIYDALPSGTLPDLYVSLGLDEATDASDKTGRGAWHRFTVSVVSNSPGFALAKDLAVTICDALIGAQPTLSRGRIVGLYFDRATAKRRDADEGRQIDLRFKARIEDI